MTHTTEFVGKLTEEQNVEVNNALLAEFEARKFDLVWLEGQEHAVSRLTTMKVGTAFNMPLTMLFTNFGILRVSSDGSVVDDKDEVLSFDHLNRVARVWRHEELVLQQPYSEIQRVFKSTTNPVELTIKLSSGPLVFQTHNAFDRDIIAAIAEDCINANVPDSKFIAFPRVVHYGWAERRGKSKWAKRYLFLTPTSLYMFRAPDSLVPIAVISNLQSFQVTKYDKAKSAVRLLNADREFVLRFESDIDQDVWMKRITRARITDGQRQQEKIDLESKRDDIYAPIKQNFNSAPLRQNVSNDAKKQAATGMVPKALESETHISKLDHSPVCGTVYSCGRLLNNRSQVFPLIVEGLPIDGVRWVSAGTDHAAIVTDDLQVYTWGKGMHGRLGHGTEKDELIPQPVAALRDAHIVQVACGGMHTAALSVDGEVWVWGAGSDGQLGHGRWHDVLQPLKLDLGGHKIKQVALGYASSAVLTMSGHLFTWGNGEQGQLGNGQKQNVNAPTPVDFGDELIRYIAVGFKHMAALTEKGEVFTWGVGVDGQLGRGHRSGQSKPLRVDHLANIPIVHISAAKHHTAAVSESGHVYTWGKKEIVGHGNTGKESSYPSNVELPERALSVHCGTEHTTVITENSTIYAWGSGANGRLGHGDEFSCPEPRLVRKFTTLAGSRRLHSASLGHEFTMTLVGNHGSGLLPPRSTFVLPLFIDSPLYPEEDFIPMPTNVLPPLPPMAMDDHTYYLPQAPMGLGQSYSGAEGLSRPAMMGAHGLHGLDFEDDRLGTRGLSRPAALDPTQHARPPRGVMGGDGGENEEDVGGTPAGQTIEGYLLPDLACGYGIVKQPVPEVFTATGVPLALGQNGVFVYPDGNAISADLAVFDSVGRVLRDAKIGTKVVQEFDRNMIPLLVGADGLLYDQFNVPYASYEACFDSLGLPLVPSTAGLTSVDEASAAFLPATIPVVNRVDIQGRPLAPGVFQPYDSEGRPILRHPDGRWVDADGNTLDAKAERFNNMGQALDALNRLIPMGTKAMFTDEGDAALIGMDGHLYKSDGTPVSTDAPLFDSSGIVLPETTLQMALSFAPVLQVMGVTQGFPTALVGAPSFADMSGDRLATARDLPLSAPASSLGDAPPPLPPSLPPMPGTMMAGPPRGLQMYEMGTDPFGRPLTFDSAGVAFNQEGVPQSQPPLPWGAIKALIQQDQTRDLPVGVRLKGVTLNEMEASLQNTDYSLPNSATPAISNSLGYLCPLFFVEGGTRLFLLRFLAYFCL
eukprot:c20184_g1_i3.p1 GENE.c20184_g1_i3~~c20184_g1_i3.p1  ORF type:complete len:1273 (-),score=308.81 c20184_g1_i3:865-4638(-)